MLNDPLLNLNVENHIVLEVILSMGNRAWNKGHIVALKNCQVWYKHMEMVKSFRLLKQLHCITKVLKFLFSISEQYILL